LYHPDPVGHIASEKGASHVERRAYINEPAAADLKKSATNFIVRLQELVGRE
jgi:hypothetical protein